LATTGRTDRPRVLVLGGGFGGLEVAKGLTGRAVDVTLVDRTNHHTFQPLLYQVATTVLSPAQIAAPLRGILGDAANVEVLMAEAVGFDLAGRRVLLDDGALPYDYLVVATGARHAYFGHPEWEEDAPGLKNVEDALDIRRRVLLAFEEAERAAHRGGPEARTPPTFAVIGAGPTGVELAGALADIARKALAGDFRHIDPRDARVVLLEGGPRVLPAYPEGLSAKARRQLEGLGVEVRTDSMVTAVEADRVRIGDEPGEWLDAAVILWASGVQASKLGPRLVEAAGETDEGTDEAGRVRVTPTLTLPGHDEVFVIGDLARLDGPDGRPLPGVAPVAIQQGQAVVKTIRGDLEGRERKPFRYTDKGSLATIGRKRAVGEVGPLRLSGLIAWLGWLFVHVLFLIGFHNRVAVMWEWMWAYFFSTYRSARLITAERVHREPDKSTSRHNGTHTSQS
jgi:NADH:ubiquinone reductase (H+-translocating)